MGLGARAPVGGLGARAPVGGPGSTVIKMFMSVKLKFSKNARVFVPGLVQ